MKIIKELKRLLEIPETAGEWSNPIYAAEAGNFLTHARIAALLDLLFPRGSMADEGGHERTWQDEATELRDARTAEIADLRARLARLASGMAAAQSLLPK